MRSLDKILKDLNSDSKSKYDKACSEIVDICRDHIDKLDKISSKYKESFKEYSDYQSDRGCLYFDEIIGDSIYLKYIDTWGYGGSCDETIKVKIDDLINYDYKQYELTVKNKRILKLNSEKYALTNRIQKIDEEIESYEKKL